MTDEPLTEIQQLIQGLQIFEKYDSKTHVYAHGSEVIEVLASELSREDTDRLLALGGWVAPDQETRGWTWA